MRRLAARIIAIFCLLLALLCVVLTFTSLRWTMAVEVFQPGRHGKFVAIHRSALAVGYEGSGRPELKVEWIVAPTSDVSIRHLVPGVVWHTAPNEEFVVGVPLWLVALLPGWISWMAWKRRNPPPVGVCRVCGYDLRASPQRCPECGTELARIAGA